MLSLISCKKEKDDTADNLLLLFALNNSIPTTCAWTQRTSPINSISSIKYINNLFVAVGGSDQIATSPDGITWVTRNVGSTATWSDIAFGNGLFAVNALGTGGVITSADGIIWTTRSSSTLPFSSIVFDNNLFVSVGRGNNLTSSDGITWTERTAPAQGGSTNSWQGPVYGNGLFVSLNGDGEGMSSSDGITWTKFSISSSRVSIFDLAFGNGTFVGISGTAVVKSKSLTNWTIGTGPSLRSIAYGNNQFVAGSSSGAIYTSTCAD